MKRLLFLLILITWFAQAVADYPLEIIQLNSRPVAEVIPILKPFIDKDGSIAGMNNQLIIRTSPDNLVEIKQILRRIDQPPRMLQISVRQSAGNQISQRATQADVNTLLGKHAKVIVGRPQDNDLRLQMKQARTQSAQDATHTLQVLEGHAAFIDTGQSVPVPEQTTIVQNNTIHQQMTTRYKNVTSGFYVIPRVNGSIVTLEITPYMSRTGTTRGQYELQQAHSVVSGKLGEWITLGGTSQSVNRQGDRILKNTHTVSSEERSIELRVDELKP
ncbi:secretin N-terminal domain-containing protein [Sedimenticola sp.]|uniref:secretin N-terminal domain-containing protein n=1 Tax=Sedimenticola sp. TaxID=1940285 RepID=UPI003D09F935